jgi:hypothetical protein
MKPLNAQALKVAQRIKELDPAMEKVEAKRAELEELKRNTVVKLLDLVNSTEEKLQRINKEGAALMRKFNQLKNEIYNELRQAQAELQPIEFVVSDDLTHYTPVEVRAGYEASEAEIEEPEQLPQELQALIKDILSGKNMH